MFLTRFRLNPARRGARKLMASPHALHAAVRAGFPNDADYAHGARRTLWRLDVQAQASAVLYVVSPGKPDFTHLVEQAGWPTTTEACDTRDYSPLLDTLRAGQRWAFRLTANPVHNGRKPEGAKDTQRFGLLRESEQVDWLLNRGQRHGFQIALQRDGVPNLALNNRQTMSFRRNSGSVTLVTATYDGVLEVTDADAFRATLTAGIGHAKAYGCGLLTLAPLR